MMNSCLYKARVMHHRLLPKKHRFHYNVFMFYVDLDELEPLSEKLRFFSLERFNFFSFRKKEHLQLPREHPDQKKSTKEQLIRYLAENGFQYGGQRIMLLTNMNILGYNFNPVSFYFVMSDTGQPQCAVAEVNNTFGEIKPFFISQNDGRSFKHQETKHFYVSPFMDHDTEFVFSLDPPSEKLNIRIDSCKNGERLFISTLTGEKKPLGSMRLFWYGLRFPLLTLRIISLIHLQAFYLWLKKIPYHKKNADLHLQKNVFRKYEKV